jgi:cytoskeletal protein CcmA (bactofilin family)
MIAKPTPAFWRGAASSFGNNVSRTGKISDWIARTWRWRPSLLASWRGENLARNERAETEGIGIEHLAIASSMDTSRAGGMLMIFRKEGRSDSFQRQVTSLRKQAQEEDDLGTDEFHFEEPQDTSQFATAKPATRDEEFISSRSSAEDLTRTQAIPQAQTAYRPTWQTADATTSIISANSNWNGVLRTEGSINVHGRAEGELHAESDVYVAEGAEVDAQIYAVNVVVAGSVNGKIEARGRLEILAQGHVSGDVKSARLVVHEGAQLSGQLKMDSGSSVQAYSTDAGSGTGRRGSR